MFLALAAIYPLIKKFLPLGSKRLDWSDHRQWELESCPGGRPQVVPSNGEMLLFVTRFNNRDNGNWSQMMLWFDEAKDFRGWAGIKLRVVPDEVYPGCSINLQMRMWNGATYRSQFFPLEGRDFIFLFQEMVMAGWSAPNPLCHLNLSAIKGVIIGLNSPYDGIGVQLGRFQLIDYPNGDTGSVTLPIS